MFLSNKEWRSLSENDFFKFSVHKFTLHLCTTKAPTMHETCKDKQGYFVRVISRKSQLAMAQTHWVLERVRQKYPNVVFEVNTIETSGDKCLDQALPLIGGKGLFTVELENALLSHSADIAVHSLKDLPLELPESLQVGAVLPRCDPCDAVVFREPMKYTSLADLPDGAVVGTSSLRRKYTILNKFPRLHVCDVRGNLQTRIAKLRGMHATCTVRYDAIILATAGIERSDLSEKYHKLSDEDFMHAPGQGFLAVQCRRDDPVLRLFTHFGDTISSVIWSVERTLLRCIGGGCHTPLAVHTVLTREGLFVKASLFSSDGIKHASAEAYTSPEIAEENCKNIAKNMLSQLEI